MPNFRPHWMLAGVLAIGSFVALPGCQKYVNIPSQTGDVASANVNGSNARDVMGEALRGLWLDTAGDGPYLVLLPAGATPKTYNDVLARGGEAYTWADRDNASDAIDQIEIRAVRIRGLNASVDIIRSSDQGNADAPRQLVTVHLKDYIVGGWASRDVRIWRMSVADALKQSQGDPIGGEVQP